MTVDDLAVATEQERYVVSRTVPASPRRCSPS